MKPAKLLLYILIFAAVIAGTIAWQIRQTSSDSASIEQTPPGTPDSRQPGQRTAGRGDESQTPAVLGDVWQFDQAEAETAGADPERAEGEEGYDGEIELDEFQVYQALANVRLDDDGNLLLDPEALIALELYFSELAPELSVTELARLQEIIRDALPGALGQDTAEVVGNYYNYRVAEVDLIQTYGEPETIEGARERFDHIVALREQTLGSDVAQRLFELEQIQAYYMMDSMALQFDTSLTDEEREERQQELYERLPPELRQELEPEGDGADEGALASDSDED
jgi:hypothetical protein